MRPENERRIVIEKSARRLRLYAGPVIEREFPVSVGRGAAADKSVEGDEATPLGDFYICARNPRSRFYLSLCISYPNEEHARRGLRNGLISEDEYRQIVDAVANRRTPPQKTRLGGEIYIHGDTACASGESVVERGDGTVRLDWTRGCIAVHNVEMRELYDLVELGTPVSIRP